MTASTHKNGIIGLGVMGLSLARNMHSKGFSVLGYDTQATSCERAQEHEIHTTESIDAFVNALESPRRILIMVPAGEPVDAVLSELTPLLSPGDSVVDAGNSYFKDTERREQELEQKGIHFLGLGVSGGRKGALEGPGMMAGGSKTAYALWKDVLEAIAAEFEGKPCVGYLGPGGAGHYVKMVHNGIEYGMMQVLAEAYILLRKNNSPGITAISTTFQEWQQGSLGGYLTEITADILSKDDGSGNSWIDSISDRAKHKGTGTWTVQNSLELGIPVPGIDAALRQRQISAHRDVRQQIEQQLQQAVTKTESLSKNDLSLMGESIYIAQLLNYLQGMHLLSAAKAAYGYTYGLQQVAAIWRNGCIISSKIVEFLAQVDLDNHSHPILAPGISEVLKQNSGNLQRLVSQACTKGVSIPALSANWNYLNSFSDANLPTNLIQAQRDYFGGHGLELKSGKKTSLDWEGSTSQKPDSD